MKRPLVSVIIPVYNGEEFIVEAIESVLNQTYQNIEIIVIDDKSTDGTLDRIKSYLDKSKNIKLITNKVNVGIGKNRQIGIDAAKGKYICWQDADDISLPKRIELQVEYLERHPGVGVVGGFIRFFDEQGDGKTRRYAEKDKDLRSSIFKYNPVAQPAAMYRAECFANVGGFNSDYRVSEDLEMLFRTGTRYEFANIQKVIVKYRQYQGSLTASKLREMEQVALAIRKAYKNHPKYNYTISDGFYICLQKLSILLPTKLRMTAFKIIRGDSK